ncbi:hypothetical protein ACPPVV_16780 [Rhodanobacter sp. Col0626]|uniref:hypothetical protein n=1 Tax=Rhodanobacter sp. Col0626 TaxID=3415679 RepID=UPI003CF27FEF
MTVTPGNIVAAAFFMQFSIFAMIAITMAILPSRTRGASVLRDDEFTGVGSPRVFWIVFALFLSTFFFLLVSDAFTLIWGPMYGMMKSSMMTWSTSLLIVFILDYVLIGALCWQTGSSRSPFVSLIVSLPALSIFLREPAPRVIAYTIISCTLIALFVMFLSKASGRDADARWRLAQVVMAACTLLFATWIGLITRPI